MKSLIPVAGAIILAILFLDCSEDEGDSAVGSSESLSTRPRTNVLLITVDTLRADHLPMYGATSNMSVPAFQFLTDNGFLFEQAVTPAPLTLPAHASILTGKLPSSHGARDNGLFSLNASARTLAEILKAYDYRTGAFVSSFVLDKRYGLGQGFDVYDDKTTDPQSSVVFAERRGQETAQKAIFWIFNEDKDQPFFCWIHLFDPHKPYDPPEPFKTQYNDSPYDGEIAYTDQIIGEIYSVLSREGVLDNTLSIVTADHGEGLGDHGELTHGLALYDTTMRVPLFFHGPGIPARGRSNLQARLTDIAPTVLDWLDVKSAAAFDGRSLRPAIEGKPMEEAPAILETTTGYFLYDAPPIFGLRLAGYKLIRGWEDELYDLSADPSETSNKMTSRLDTGRRLKDRLDSVLAAFPPLPQATIPAVEEIEKLKALGYLGGGQEGADFSPSALHKLIDDMVLAQNLLNVGRRKKARELLDQVISTYPRNVEALRLIGDDELAFGDPARALEIYDLAKANSRIVNPVVDLNRALCLLALGRHDDARSAVLDVLSVFPNHTDALRLGKDLGIQIGNTRAR